MKLRVFFERYHSAAHIQEDQIFIPHFKVLTCLALVMVSNETKTFQVMKYNLSSP